MIIYERSKTSGGMVLTVAQVATAMGIGRAAAYQLARREDFPALRVGTRIIIPREAFLRWLDAQAEKTEQ